MRVSFILIILLIAMNFLSSAQKLLPGKYIYEANKSYFTIKKDNNYYFSTIGNVHEVSMFSKGKVLLKNSIVNFIPDSSLFLHIDVLKYYFDSSLKENRKIILENTNSDLSGFQFSFYNGSISSIIKFGNNYSTIYKPATADYQKGSISLKAKLKDSILILPRLLHDSITSNTIDFFDVNDDDPNNKPWNVLELKVSISRDMFAFAVLPSYIFKGNKLIEKNCPIYELSKQ